MSSKLPTLDQHVYEDQIRELADKQSEFVAVLRHLHENINELSKARNKVHALEEELRERQETVEKVQAEIAELVDALKGLEQ